MDETVTAATGIRNVSAAQAGRLLCVSETIYPHGPRHDVRLICGSVRTAGGLRPSSCVRMAGEEFVDLRALAPAAPARTAGGTVMRPSREVYGGGADPYMERDGGR